MAFFQNSVLKKYLATQDQPLVKEAYTAYQKYFHHPQIRENIRAAKEEQFQEGFLRELFVNILGYTINPNPDYDLTTELKNIKDAKKTDGAILKDGKALAVIELKGTDTKDLEKIRDQAFNYKNNQPECVYVITSNFEKLRFYIDNAVDFLEFNILAMQLEEFKVFWLLLQKENLLSGIPKKIKEQSLLVEEQITKQLYADYSAFKQELWQDMVKLNAGTDELELYKKSQKLLDRFLFIFFAEDKGLLPPNSIMEIVTHWNKLCDLDEYRPLYQIFKKYFGYLNTGRVQPGKAEIHAYNGGLFAPDPILDALEISDQVLEKHVRKLTEYDFESEVDTNILGHIFEHSLNDIENVRAQLAGEVVDRSKTKRKRDGVFYTPKYITKYIVDNTLGKLCTEKKAELEIVDEDFAEGKRGRQKKTIQRLKEKLDTYRSWLLQLTICDPACGSGAFLNQVLEFLMAEHRYVDELESQLFDSPLILPNVENHILENNIFGVDINEESVQIARLSLWLRTAKKGRKLSSLNSNIKVGNSLIDDPEVAGDLAFNWSAQFPKVFAKGGFDVVVGNPPYVDIKALDPELVKVLFKTYQTAENRINLYSIFIEKGYYLLKDKGFLSFINPNSILINSSYTKIRKLLMDDMTTIVKLPDSVFEDAIVETVIFEFRKGFNSDVVNALVYPKDLKINSIDNLFLKKFNKSGWKNNDSCNFNIFISPEINVILDKTLENSVLLETLADFTLGITPYDKYKGHSEDLIKNRDYHSDIRINDTYKPLISGGNITRYHVSNQIGEYIKYGEWLGAARDERFFTNPRILIRQIVSGNPPRIYAGYTDEELYFTQIGFGIIPKPNTIEIKSLLAILNSTLINFYHKYSFLDLEKELFQKILIANCKRLPVNMKVIGKGSDLETPASQIIEMAKEFNKLKIRFIELLEAKFPIEKLSTKLQNWPSLDFKGFLGELKKAKVQLSLAEEAEWMAYFNEQKSKAQSLQSDITRLDREIDNLVYELYGLTEEEIRIVEGD
ncbi:type I restriction-modification system methyltransferase subunit [Belliella baltica DSM 15883]|uniref:site-specific DNA-methyltransferase (adenine-specific) n=1 Tax=Belliella baltica (strain DSM 15883 / CIP 108006 / LMG 21964 / BA134) TaxID=866536 RepID=I3Z7Q0_BELBD|nr:N-6 DNA methylase [Belliella baltica]AFL85268.1 type I restriction-modification system methyltransferase subunit [Belliella baltica DSM 15883]